ncbi:Uncharacterized protein APZ42_012779 [Daphnia magna]|uniref:Uncharacterized protein n=1 Tax=Daphnia magna TaxID=35525 RepID=A0A162RHG0_9CRUS|nr:Uncharacterized protein APZ42_012779 [Daphnia magna]
MVLSLSMLIANWKDFSFSQNFTIFMVYFIACRWIVTWHHLNGMVHISSVMMHFLNTPIPQKIF